MNSESRLFCPKNHDLALPFWGPYGKQYAGASHIADKENGLRFDFTLIPALYRRRVAVPAARWESDWHPWESAPRFEYFSFRHQIVDQDRIYADISYSKVEGMSGLLVRCELVNTTGSPCATALHFMASLAWPSPWPNSREPIRRKVPLLPEGAISKHALDYVRIAFARTAATDGLNPDGLLRGETRGQEFLDGSGLGGRFGRDVGDTVTYHFEISEFVGNSELIICGSAKKPPSIWQVEHECPGEVSSRLFQVAFTDESLSLRRIPFGNLKTGRHVISLTAVNGTAGTAFSFLAFVPEGSEIPLQSIKPRWAPARLDGPGGKSLILKYADVSSFYGLAWETDDFEIREILHSELDVFLRANVHDHVQSVLKGDEKGYFTNIFLRPLVLPPDGHRIVWGLICEGSQAEVERELAAFATNAIDKGALFSVARRKSFTFRPGEAGEDHVAGQNLMAATTLTNIVFPIYTQRQYIRHRTPGKLWDSLYTWDAGFIGLGLLEIDPMQAEENLAQYLTEPGNLHAAFIHHGSMVPMQIHLYHELWNRTCSQTLLERYYHVARQYYLFFIGSTHGSTTRTPGSGLLRSWDYFYNSGGWDDYPAQKHVHANGLADRTTTASVTAHAVRSAKSLLLFAEILGQTDHACGYRQNIEELSSALQDFAWDADAGYFSYVVHNAGKASILRDRGGTNFNMGLDGVYPLVAGICDPKQERLLLDRLFDPARLWTDMGLTAVDQSAPYYRRDGYWVGTVWVAHQWFFWKTALDLGRPDLALRIANAVLETWKRETKESRNCFEHFLIETGRGCGWHQFSGLSTPVMAFFSSCYCPGKLTVGFEILPLEYNFTDNQSAFRGRLLPVIKEGNVKRSLFVSLNSGHEYASYWNGEPIIMKEVLPGLFSISLPADGKEGLLRVAKAEP